MLGKKSSKVTVTVVQRFIDFLDVAPASSMPTRRRISFGWLFLFTELVYLVQKLRNLLKLILPYKVQSFQPHRLAAVIYSLKCYMFSVNIRVFNMYIYINMSSTGNQASERAKRRTGASSEKTTLFDSVLENIKKGFF